MLLLIAASGTACEASGDASLPKRIDRAKVGESVDLGPCWSWIGPGIGAAYCAAGIETPAPVGSEEHPGQIEFTGTPRAGAEGGIAQAAGRLPTGKRIGITVDSDTNGTLVAQGMCGRTVVMASFRHVRFRKDDLADLRVTTMSSTPVILLHQNGRDIAPDREVLRQLTWMPPGGPEGCGFTIA
jgi:hypothetical protein